MEFDYGFEYAFPEIMEGTAEGIFMGAAGVVVGLLLLIWFLAMGFSVVCYVLGAVGKYRIAKRRGIHHAWLAWIPVGAQWLLGSISDHYQYVVKQKVTNRRTRLMILSIIAYALSCVIGVLTTVAVVTADGSNSVLLIALIVLGNLAITGLSIAVAVFSYIAHYDLYMSCKPNYGVLFLVLSVLFSVTQPFFVFACSGADQGMPARRPQQSVQHAYEPQQNAYEPQQSAYEPQQSAYEPQQTEEEELPVVEAEIVEDPEM